jgi:hypothetical protein
VAFAAGSFGLRIVDYAGLMAGDVVVTGLTESAAAVGVSPGGSFVVSVAVALPCVRSACP